MTEQDIKRYLALPKGFRDTGLTREASEHLGIPFWCHDEMLVNDHIAERLSIASMLVGLRKAGYSPLLMTDPISGQVMCYLHDAHDVAIHTTRADSDFLALLSACEAVVKNRGEA